MALLITDCPRCTTKQVTFDVQHIAPESSAASRVIRIEVFGVCRHCRGGTVFFCIGEADRLSQFVKMVSQAGLHAYTNSINSVLIAHHPLSLAEIKTEEPPQHVPSEILNAFIEGQKTLAIGCCNASGAMSRLTLDLATKELLAQHGDSPDVTRRIRENLNERLRFLIDKGAVPKSLEDLAHHVRLEGNDAAHDGALKENDARDLIEFCQELLRACFEQPGKVLAARKRRDERRQI